MNEDEFQAKWESATDEELTAATDLVTKVAISKLTFAAEDFPDSELAYDITQHPAFPAVLAELLEDR